MQDIHLPTGRTAPRVNGSSQPTEKLTPREHALALSQQKREIEDEIGEYIDILRGQNADFSTELIDRQGFPRADIDVAIVRSARAKIIRLRNDLKAKSEQLAKALEEVHANPEASNEPSVPSSSVVPVEESLQTWAKVNSVAEHSPAAEAGLLPEDQILRFGHLTSANHDRLRALPPFLASKENNEIKLIVKRNEQQKDLALIPRKWEGRGLLGCHVVPV